MASREASSSAGNVTSINVGYLNMLVQSVLQPLLDEVNTLLAPGQNETVRGSSFHVPAIDGTLSVPAGPNSFVPASDLVSALGKVGTSVNSDLNWFMQALTDTIDEINTTVASMKSTDDLNADQAQTILQDFAGVISDVSSSPTGGSSGGSGSGGTGSGGTGSPG